MSKLCISETNVSPAAEQLKAYWRHFGEKRFEENQLAFFNNGYFKVYSPSWHALSVYDNLSRCFINRLLIAVQPYLTFHVFGNGYMAAAKDNGYVEIYAPDGKFFAQREHRVKWWGEASAYVCMNAGNYYLADVTGAQEPVWLGKREDILNVEQNINGLTAVKFYNGRNAILYNAEMQPITPVEDADNILFFTNGSFIVSTKGVNYLYNAKMECLLKARLAMDIVDGVFCSMRGTLYDSTTGAVVDGNNLPLLSEDGKFTFQNGGLYAEDGRQVLAYCPVRPQMFAGHFLHLRLNKRDLVFDTRMSAVETRQAVVEVLFGHNKDEDISEELFEYFRLVETCLSGHKELRKKMLKGFFAD